MYFEVRNFLWAYGSDLWYRPDYGNQPRVRVPQQLEAPLHEVQPLVTGTPAGGLGGVVGEVDEGAEEE